MKLDTADVLCLMQSPEFEFCKGAYGHKVCNEQKAITKEQSTYVNNKCNKLILLKLFALLINYVLPMINACFHTVGKA